MKYKRFIKKAPPVSEIGLGTWQLGVNSGWCNMPEKEAIYMVHQSLEAGVNFFDTAPNYGLGTSETRLGKALKGTDRSKIVINTKFGHTVTGVTDFSAGHIRASIEGSLQRLQVDYVDSLIIHNPPVEYLDGRHNAHYEILERLMEEGKINAYVASLDTFEEMKLFMETTRCEVIEAFFNILHQDTARAFELARKRQVGIIVKIPLDSGWLSGKYTARSVFTDIRSRWSVSDIQTRAVLIEKVKNIIGEEWNLSQAAIAFCLAFEAVSTVIPGNTSVAQLKSNLQATEKPLPADLVKELEIFFQTDVKELHLPW